MARWKTLGTVLSAGALAACAAAGAPAAVEAAWADVSCVVGEGGRPLDCVATAESHPGFGDAAVTIVERGRLDRTTRGAAAVGASFTTRVQFAAPIP